jgi:cell division protein ftsZ
MLYPDYGDFEEQSGALIKVVGVGGGGGNAVNHMVANIAKQNVGGTFLSETALDSEEHGKIIFYAVNTDAQALRKSQVQQTVQIGGATTKGLGAGANPNVGRKAAEDDQEEIRKMLEGADMVFIAAGMGGGTGTGAAPVVAKVAKELGILTVAVVTKPFAFEGKKRMQFAELGIKDLSQYVDSMIIIPNQQIQKVLPKNATLIDAFAAANDVLRNSVMGISDMITSPGMINVDFADVRTVMSEMGQAMIGFGSAHGSPGEGRAEEAARIAVRNDLLEKVDLTNAKGILINITGGFDIAFDEFNVVGDTIHSFASEDATIVVGTTLVPEMSDEIRVTIVATGLGEITPNEVIQVQKPVQQLSPLHHPEENQQAIQLRTQEQQITSFRQPEPIRSTYNSEHVQQPKEGYRSELERPITDRLSSFKRFDPNVVEQSDK